MLTGLAYRSIVKSIVAISLTVEFGTRNNVLLDYPLPMSNVVTVGSRIMSVSSSLGLREVTAGIDAHILHARGAAGLG